MQWLKKVYAFMSKDILFINELYHKNIRVIVIMT